MNFKKILKWNLQMYQMVLKKFLIKILLKGLKLFTILSNLIKVLHSVVEVCKNKLKWFLCKKVIFKNK